MRSITATPHVVAVLVSDGVSLFELSIALEVFGADSGTGRTPYRVIVCGVGGRGAAVRSDRGPVIPLTAGLRRALSADTVVVPPHDDFDDVPARLIDTIRRAHERGARIVSLCTGALQLAAAGLLAGRRATTHWAECDELARRYPDVDVDPGVLYVDNGDVLTSAGSAASLDLCLHVVRTDCGADVAAAIARDLVVPPHRDGGQAQYIRTPLPDPDTDALFTGTLAWLHEHVAEPVTIAELARRAAMSRRTFARRFVDTVGTTPYQWLVRQRVQLAQQMLESTDLPIEEIAERAGFVTSVNLRKHFARVAHTSPLAYRRTFSGLQPAPGASRA